MKLEFFAKEQSSGESLDADEVVSRMESEEAKEMLEKEGYTMMSVTKSKKWPFGNVLYHAFTIF